MQNKIVIGCSDYYIDRLCQILTAYAAKGYPSVIFAQPQMSRGGGKPHAWLYRFYGLNFMIEMPVMAEEKEHIDKKLDGSALIMDTLSNPIKATVEAIED
jgi:hypothetical protein